MEEIFKDIEGYEGLYQISNLGNVKALNYNREKREKELKRYINRYGYFYVELCKGAKRKKITVHRLVAQAFLSNPNNYNVVNHKDENKQNNNVDNLEWCNYLYNANYGTRNKRISKPISQFDKHGNFIKRWESAKEIERILNIDSGSVSKCCKGKLKSAGGYKWQYA